MVSSPPPGPVTSLSGQNQNQTVTANQTLSTTTPVPKVEDFVGRYRLTESKNFDKFLLALGVGLFPAGFANALRTELKITKSGDCYTVQTITPFGSDSVTFQFGVEFEESRDDGRKAKSTITRKGNIWVHKQVGPNNTVNAERVFKDDQQMLFGSVGNVTFTRVYKKLPDKADVKPWYLMHGMSLG